MLINEISTLRMHTKGNQIIADFWECPEPFLTDDLFLRRAITGAAERAGAHVVRIGSCRFPARYPGHPGGVSAFAILAESHVTIHTYPETALATIDIYTCGDRCNPKRGLEYLTDILHPRRTTISEIPRGGDGALVVERNDTGI